MFEQPLGNLQYSQREFSNNVKDDFGQAIETQVYEPIGQSLQQLKDTENTAVVEKTAIYQLLMEARTII